VAIFIGVLGLGLDIDDFIALIVFLIINKKNQNYDSRLNFIQITPEK